VNGGAETFASYWHKVRRFSRDVRLYMATSALTGFTVYGGIYSVLLNLYLLRLGQGPAFVGIVNGATWITYALFSLPAGALGSRWGVRRTMIVGMTLIAAGSGLLMGAELLPGIWQQGWLIGTRMLVGLGISLYIVNASPFLMGATGPEERDHAFAIRTALWPLAGFAGSLVGGMLPGAFATFLGLGLEAPAPYRYALLTAAVLVLPGVAVLWATDEVAVEGTPPRGPSGGVAPYGLIIPIVWVGVLRLAAEGGVGNFINVYMDAALNVPTAQIGTLMALGQLLAAPASLVMPLLRARWGQGRTVVWSVLGAALCLLLLALVPHWAAAALGYMGMVTLAFAARPAFTVYTQELVVPAWQPLMSGAVNLAAGLGSGLMMLGGGYVVAGVGYQSLFLIAAGLMAAGALLFWAIARVPRGEFAHHP
jgi:MFS family permease